MAERRIDRVNGRINKLTVSIITINGIIIKGVLEGVKWDINWLKYISKLMVIIVNHKGRESLRDIFICLVEVKI